MKSTNYFARFSLAAFKRLIAMIAIFAIFSNAVFAATFTVNSSGDGADENGADNICEATDGVADCTFRAAVNQANTSAGTDTIEFQAGTTTITPGSTITISSNIIVNSSATNRLVMDGNSTALNALVLDGSSDGSQIRGVTFNDYDGAATTTAIEIQSGADSITIGGSVDYANIIGLGNDSTTASADTRNGIGISSAGTNVTINRNYIANNTTGIKITGGTGQTITKNTIGLDSALADKGNTGDGILVSGTVALTGAGLVIGGNQASSLDNAIGGNGGNGIRIGDSTGSITGSATIMGNFIGTDAGNDGDGLLVDTDASGLDLTIGTDGNGSTDGTEGNEIGLNGGDGVEIKEADDLIFAGNKVGFTANGTVKANTGTGIIVGTASVGPNTVRLGSDNADSNEMNSIGSNAAGGVLINNATTINMSGNYIGFGPGGENDRPNTGGAALKIAGSQVQTVNLGTGGTVMGDAARNFFGNNTGGLTGTVGITNTATGATVNIRNNRLGVSPTDLTTAKANTNAGGCFYLTFPGTVNFGTNLDGTNDDYEYNEIANCSGGNGIYIGNGVTTANIMGGMIGLLTGGFGNLSHTVAAGNGSAAAAGDKSGIKIDSNTLTSLTAGGTSAYQRNVIGSNYEHGIYIVNLATSAVANLYNSYIGVGENGTTDRGNVLDGINISTGAGASGATFNIGGTSTSQGNIISGNGSDGIDSSGTLAATLNIYQNTIGLRADGTAAMANDANGIKLANSNATVTIGNSTSGGRNLISGNTSYGVDITGGNVTLKGNYLGMATNGTTALVNTVGSLRATGPISNLTIGGSASGAANTIANTTTVGVVLNDVTTSNETAGTFDTDNTWLSRQNATAATYNFWNRYVSSVLTAYAPQVCYDYLDNDSDGIADWGAGVHDLGCDSTQDTTENTENGAGGGGGGGGGGGSSSSSSSSSASNNAQATSTPTETRNSESAEDDAEEFADRDFEEEEEIADRNFEEPEEEFIQPEEVPVAESTEAQRNVREFIIRQKLDESVSSVTNTVLNRETVNLNLILTDIATPVAEVEVVTQPKTPAQQVVTEAFDKLDQGEQLTASEQKRVESTAAMEIKKSVDTIFSQIAETSEDAPAIQVIDSNGKAREINRSTQFVFSLDVKKAADEQKVVDAQGENKVVLTPSSMIGESNVSALLEVEGGKVGDPLSADKIFFKGLAGLGLDVDSAAQLVPEQPTITNILPGMEMSPKFVLWTAGPRAGEQVTVFAIDKVDAANPKTWKIHDLGNYNLDETNKAGLDLDLSSKMDADVKNFTIVVQDEDGKGQAQEATFNRNNEMKLDTVYLKDGEQVKPADLTDKNKSFSDNLKASVLLAMAENEQEEAAKTKPEAEKEMVTLSGYAEPGSVVFVTWKSVLMNSAVIADASQGYFEVQVPKQLAKGEHTALTYSYNKGKKTASSPAKVQFKKFL